MTESILGYYAMTCELRLARGTPPKAAVNFPDSLLVEGPWLVKPPPPSSQQRHGRNGQRACQAMQNRRALQRTPTKVGYHETVIT